MGIVDLSVKRPILMFMVVATSLVLGAISFLRLGVDEYPDISPPVVTVTTSYPGAGPLEIETLVSRPLEEEIGQLGGIEKLTSVSREGISQVIVEFKLEMDAKLAQVDVRDRVSRAAPQFPEEVEEPLVQRLDFNERPILQLALQGKNMDEAALWLMAEYQVKPLLQQINGVGQVDIFGGKEREILISLDKRALELWKISPAEVVNAIKMSNLNTPAGSFTEYPTQRAIRVIGEYQKVSEVKETVVKTLPGNRTILVKDVAVVTDDLKESTSLARVDGQKVVILEVKKQSDANTVKVANETLSRLTAINQKLDGAEVKFVFDGSKRIRNTVNDVIETLIIAAILVVLVVYIFLGSWQSTFVTGLALPMTLIASFSLLYLMDYTLNIMTLLGLTLIVGLILDDAIVVRENIWNKVQSGLTAKKAAISGTKEVFWAVIATSATLLAVFLPITVIPGVVGRFFTTFALTVCAGILFSTFDALVIAPMFSAYMPIDPQSLSKRPKILSGLDKIGGIFADFYNKILSWSLENKLKVLLFSFVVFILSLLLVKKIGFTFLPQTERGELQISLEGPAGLSLEKTNRVVSEIEQTLKKFEDIDLVSSRIGSEFAEKNIAQIYVRLKKSSERNLKTSEMKSILRELLKPLSLRERFTLGVVDPGGGGGNRKAIQISITGPSTTVLEKLGAQVVSEAQKKEGTFTDLDYSMKPGQEEEQFLVDRTRLSANGLTARDLGRNMRVLFDGEVAGVFREANMEFDIRVRLNEKDRRGNIELKDYTIPNSRGEMIPLQAITHQQKAFSPTKITRVNRMRAVTIEGDVATGAPLKLAIEELKKMISPLLPSGYGLLMEGQAKNLQNLAIGFFVAMGLATLFMYMILAGLYESLIIPFVILTTLPFAIVGAFWALFFSGKFLDVYTIIGLIMLLGLVSKNAILIIEYVEQLRAEGISRLDALLMAGNRRLRPIMMTSASTVAGFIPVAIGLGEVNKERAGLGIACIGGLLVSTFLSLVVVPCSYIYFDNLKEFLSKKMQKFFYTPSVKGSSYD